MQINIGPLFGKAPSITILNNSYVPAHNGKQLDQTFSKVNSH